MGAATKDNSETDLFKVFKEAEEYMYENKIDEGKEARLAIVEISGKLLHKKSYETKEHIERLEALAVEFAEALDFSKENLNNLVQAVKIHDIGKIGISEDIVLKESNLSESEWTIMKKHVEIGYRLARISGEFAHLADIIYCHHERRNGQGYPQGLKGEDIPQFSRIISIIHAFDVMTHRQPYKAAGTVNESLHELSRKAGIQFAPALVQVFIEMMNNKTEGYGSKFIPGA